MEKLKQYVVLTVLGCLMIVAAGWFLLVSPKRTEAAELRTAAAEQVTANAQLSTQLQVLKAQAKDLPKQQAKLAAVAARIPDNPALPGLVRNLVTAAQSASVELLSVTPGAPVVVAGAPAAPVAAPAAAAGAAPAAAAAPGAAASAGQLASIPLTVTIAGGYFQVSQFVANLENLGRSMRITNLSVAPGANPMKPRAEGDTSTVDDGKSLMTTITGQVFMAANRAPATAANVPGQAAGSAAAATVTAPVAPAKK